MSKYLLIITFLLLLPMSVVAQSVINTESDLSEKTKKVDEFGQATDCDLSARVDNLFIEINNTPNSKGYVILYKGKEILPANYDSNTYEKRIKQQIEFRKYDPDRIVIIDGGFRETVTNEFFLVPENSEIPVPTETIEKPLIPTDKTFLFDSLNFYIDDDSNGYTDSDEEDEFLLPSVKVRSEAEQLAAKEEARAYEIENQTENESNEETNNDDSVPSGETEEEFKPTPEQIENAKFYWAKESFGEMIKRQKGSQGVIIFYADDQYYDLSKLQMRLEEGKKRIAERTEISSNNIQIIFGGYRNFMQLEFWIVPKNCKPPIPNPTERPAESSEEDTEFRK
ncbi:MAG: hypothetical protein LUM44_14845 [Pyrinomonadaceae bacterium]|nr:hypothetical protein [Pyrinomonadaceae bacterium]